MRVKLKEIQHLLSDKFIIYTFDPRVEDANFAFKNLWKSKGCDSSHEIPANLLERTVCALGARRKGVLDICVEPEQDELSSTTANGKCDV